MVGPGGIEPPISRVSDVRFHRLSYGPFVLMIEVVRRSTCVASAFPVRVGTAYSVTELDCWRVTDLLGEAFVEALHIVRQRDDVSMNFHVTTVAEEDALPKLLDDLRPRSCAVAEVELLLSGVEMMSDESVRATTVLTDCATTAESLNDPHTRSLLPSGHALRDVTHGCRRRTRTLNIRDQNPPLYQLSYSAAVGAGIEPATDRLTAGYSTSELPDTT